MAEHDPYELAHQIDRLMRRINAGVVVRAPVFDTERVGPIGGMILLTIAEVEPSPMQQIADAMARDKAQLSRAVSMLERRGLVMKSPHASDQRSTLLRLTEKGHAFVQQIRATLADVIDTALEPLSPAERAQLLEMLSKL
ncbi:MAG: winged helix DNA-binding protein [Pseudomonadota bacterium]